jgi:diguanylate cyclase (GGDEF)-like protein/PAS domain S-box-containing protein
MSKIEMTDRETSSLGDESPVRVLIVEDVLDDAQLIVRVLTRSGLAVEVERVDNEKDLRRALREGSWDLVLTDFRLPSLDGLEVLSVLRDEGVDAPAILVSGTVGEEIAASAIREGARDFVLKDNLARLPQAARREIAHAKQRAQGRRLERILSALRDVAFETGKFLDPAGQAHHAIVRARELLDVDIASLYWWNDKRQLLELLAESEQGGGILVETIAPGQGASGVAFERRAPVFIDDYSVWPQRLGDLRGSALAVPALVGDRILGTLYVRSLALRRFSEADAQSLQLLASQVAPAIEVGRLLVELRASEQRFTIAFRRNPVGIIATRVRDNTIVDVNDSLLQLVGYSRDEFVGRPASDFGLATPRAEEASTSDVGSGRSRVGIEVEIRGRHGEPHNAIVYAEPIELDGEPAVLSTVVDVTARRSAERMLQHNSLHDELTGLPNRVHLYERLHSLIGRPQPADRRFALLLADLDGFAALNEEFGHHGADLVLTQTARRLRTRLSSEQFLARTGGNEFALILSGTDDPERVARELLLTLDTPFAVGDQQVLIGASIGIAQFPEHATAADDLLRCAASALQAVKPMGWSYGHYQATPRTGGRTSLGLLAEFRDAITRDELVLFYQPQFELPSRRLVGAEALLRWQHPNRGLLAPAIFLPSAERTGLMRPLLEWVLRTALEETRASGLHVAVNLAVRNILEPGLRELVANTLDKTGRSPTDLTLEITESGVMSNPEAAAVVLDDLRALGCRLSIDDFGTGYSSMAYLQRLPAHELKIDRSFVAGIPRQSHNTSIVQASIALAHGLGLVVVAEGVEDEANLAALMTLHCDRAQGYLLGKPAPAKMLATAT